MWLHLNDMSKKEFIEGKHYYLQNGLIIMTERYHKERGYCCGSKCMHCPYEPRHEKGNKNILPDEVDNNKQIK